MKTILPLLTILLVLLSCSKNNDTASNIVTPPIDSSAAFPDTLSAGWTSKQVGNGFGDIYFQNNLIGYTVEDSIFKTVDGGNTWLPIASNGNNDYWFNITGTPNNKIFAVGGTNKVLSSSDGGINFDTVQLSSGSLSDIYFYDNNNGFITTHAGNLLYQTIDAGITWNPVQPLTGLSVSGYTSSFFLNSTTGWIIGATSICRMNGSVNTWAPAIINQTPTGGFCSIYASNANTIYATTFDGQVYKSTDGGANFHLIKEFFSDPVFSDVYFADDNTGYVCAGKRIYKTVDGGDTWQTVVAMGTVKFVELHFTDAHHGWACGDNSIGGYVLTFAQ